MNPPSNASVIVLVHDQAPLLRNTLRGLRDQDTTTPFEIIVTDDGSSDDVLDAVREAEGHFDLRYVRQAHRAFRAGRARNNGARLALNELLIFLDGDVLVDHNFVATHVRMHTTERLVLCGTRRHIQPAAASSVTSPEAFQSVLTESRTAERESQLRWLTTESPWMSLISFCFSVRNSQEVRFDEQMTGWGSEDRELAFRLFSRHGYRFACPTDLPPVLHVAGSEWMTHDKIVQGIRNKLYLLDRYPLAQIAPALRIMRRWNLDPVTDRWRGGPERDTPLATVIDEARSWIRRMDESSAAICSNDSPTRSTL